MRRSLAVLLWVLTACAGAVEPSGTSGIEGQVLAGPVCPVETEGSPCPPEPWIGTVRATAEDGSVLEATTDAEGRYRLALTPGTYEVVAVTDAGPPTGIPQTVQVADGQQLRLDLEVDTGIR